MKRRNIVLTFASVAALASLTACATSNASPASEVAYPTKTVRIVVPYPAGGGVDIAARAVAPCLEEKLGKTVIVENKAGGSGAVGTTDMLGRTADGHTLEMVLTSSAVVTPLNGDVGYKLDDLQEIGQVAAFPYVILVNPKSPFKNLQDLLKADMDLKAGTPGAASQGDLELRAIKKAGVRMTLVPFDGTAGVKAAILGNQVDFGTAVVDDDLLKQHKAGTVRILGVTSAERVDYLPDTPAVKEIDGFKDLGAGTSLIGLVAKQGTSEKIVSTLSSHLATCLKNDSTRKVIGEQFVADAFVAGPELEKAYKEQSTTYAAIIGG
jgi:tripartite-type tricarboxylate transporter receptor subunit TctC